MRKLKITELSRITTAEFKIVDKIPLIVILDQVRSLNNIGSVFRTSDAFRVESIYLCGITATPPNSEIHKTALGAEFSVDWKYFENTVDAIRQLQSENVKVFAIEQVEKSVMLQDFEVEEGIRYAIVFGNEVKGVDQKVVDVCDGCIEIPQFGTKHSLNVSVTAGIVVWDLFQKLSQNLSLE
ncbi:MAG: methyltransferase [Bacteroidetes bacterium]|nr:methyltransferase [Bacteroidota bacterium]